MLQRNVLSAHRSGMTRRVIDLSITENSTRDGEAKGKKKTKNGKPEVFQSKLSIGHNLFS